MAGTFLLEVATPERLLIHEQVTEAQIPAANGYLGILPGHSPLLGELGIGELSYETTGGQRQTIVVEGGWVQVLPTRVRVLADSAERISEIDLQRAEEALRAASERLAHPAESLDQARALNALRRAQARVNAAKHG